MKTICIITSSHGRSDIRLFQKHTNTLVSNSYNVIYVLNDGKEDESGDNYRITTLGLPKASKLQRLFTLSSKLFPKLYELNADLYQVCDPELIALGTKLKKVGKTVIFDSVEDWEGYFKCMINPWVGLILSKVVTLSFKRHLNNYNKVLVMSPNIQKRLDCFAPGKVEIVSNYPIITNHPTNGLSHDEFFANQNQFIYCGSVYGFSIQEDVVDAIDNYRDIDAKYVIVGSTSDARKQSILKNKSKNVEFIPWVKKEELLQLYRKSICGVVIFQYTPVCCGKEGQMGSNKIFEYMLEGLPVICTDYILWKKLIIDKYHCGICVNPDDKNAIAEAVHYISTHREEAYKMGVNARNAVLTEFNWENQAKKYLGIIEELVQ